MFSILNIPNIFMRPSIASVLAFFVLMSAASAEELRFVALGDLPYGKDEISGRQYRKLIKAINQTDPAFSIHVGDIKSGSTLCSNEELDRQRQHFELFSRAIIYTPGDNDWTDCHRASNGGYDPLERLDYVRKYFFYPERSLGQRPIKLESQAQLMPEFKSYVENERWIHSSILFITLHVVGSNNNFETRDLRAVAEFFDRDSANIAWIKTAFSFAKEQKVEAVVVSFQADIFESRSERQDFPDYSGFRNAIGKTLLPLIRDFKKPVLIIHGDNHTYRFDQPFSLEGEKLTSVYRLVVPGDQVTKAVLVRTAPLEHPPFSGSLIEP